MLLVGIGPMKAHVAARKSIASAAFCEDESAVVSAVVANNTTVIVLRNYTYFVQIDFRISEVKIIANRYRWFIIAAGRTI